MKLQRSSDRHMSTYKGLTPKLADLLSDRQKSLPRQTGGSDRHI
jgi:hypothetical protein